MRVRDEELVQFLLGEADQVLRQRVEAALAADPRISKRLEELRAALGLLDSLKLASQPPDDLVARTMSRIDAEVVAASHGAESNGSGSSDGAVELRRSTTGINAARPALRSGRQFWDSAVLSLSVVVICGLMLPLMLEARSQSRRLQCSHNLAAIGRGLTEWAMMNGERRFPTIPASGPEGFAGMSVMYVNDARLVDLAKVRKCPSLRDSASSAVCLLPIPSREEFARAPSELQDYWRPRVGGDYAYNLGVLDEGRITAPRLEGRTYFAIAADATRFKGDEETFVAHEGRGFNIYYEDGHVAFIPRLNTIEQALPATGRGAVRGDQAMFVRSWLPSSDNPFRNADGDLARGSHPGDSVVGPSAASPLPKRFPLR